MDAQDEETPKHGKKTRHHNDRKQKAREAQGTHMRKAQEVGQEQRSRKWSRMVQHRRPGMRFTKRSNPSREYRSRRGATLQAVLKYGFWSLAVPRAFIICTGLTIKANAGPVKSGEDQWTLALAFLRLPNAYMTHKRIGVLDWFLRVKKPSSWFLLK